MYSGDEGYDVLEFGVQLNSVEPIKEPVYYSHSMRSPQSSAGWKSVVIAKSPRICSAVALFFLVMFGGSLLIANSSDDLKLSLIHI